MKKINYITNKGLDSFLTKWEKAIIRWEKTAKQLRNMPIAVHHRSFSYLIDWLNLNQIATLEPVPGIPPTISNLEKILKILKEDQIKVIIRTNFDNAKAAKWMSKKLDVPVIILPFSVGANKTKNLEELFNYIIESLIKVNNP